jgi:hypothetical protein
MNDFREREGERGREILTSAVSTVTLTEISLPLTVSKERPFLLGLTEPATTWYVRMEVSLGISLRRAGGKEN